MAAGAAAAATAQAIRASGAIVRVSPEDFRNLAERGKAPLVARTRSPAVMVCDFR